MKHIKTFEGLFGSSNKGIHYWFDNEIAKLKELGFEPNTNLNTEMVRPKRK